MTSQGILTLPRRLLVLAAGMILALASVALVASPASAHDQLLGSTPAANSTVDSLPTELVLTFSAVIGSGPGASEVQVTDAAGTQLAGTPVEDGTNLVVPLEGEGSGAIRVLWKVVSSDGHPISGEFSFTATGAPSPTASPTETPTSTPTPTPTETTPAQSPTATETPAPAPVSEPSSVTAWIIVGLLLFAAVGGAVLYLLLSRVRRQKALAEASPNESDTPSER